MTARRFQLLVLGLSVFVTPMAARAHVPSAALLRGPVLVGNVVDEAYGLEWVDSDAPVPTGTVTFSFYYTAEDPPTYSLGERPLIDGQLIVRGVPERVPLNRHTWDTSQVPAGTYRLYSVPVELPEQTGPIVFVAASSGFVTVAHPGDPVHPAVVFTSTANQYMRADEDYTVRYAAFDPDGTGRVRLEATTSVDGSGLFLLADDLPASEDGTWRWDTRDLPEADYSLKATVTDARGLSHSAWAQHFLVILHADSEDPPSVAERPDAGLPSDAGLTGPDTPRPDGGVQAGSGATRVPSGGAATGSTESDRGGCRCLASATDRPGPDRQTGRRLAVVIFLLTFVFEHRRRRPT